MSEMDPPDMSATPDESSHLDADALLHTQVLKNHFDEHNNLFIFNLKTGDSLRLKLAAENAGENEPSYFIEAEFCDESNGLFRITGGTDFLLDAIDGLVNLGSFGKSSRDESAADAVLMSGIIVPGSSFTLDNKGRQFFSDKSQVAIYPMKYTGLSVNGVEFF